MTAFFRCYFTLGRNTPFHFQKLVSIIRLPYVSTGACDETQKSCGHSGQGAGWCRCPPQNQQASPLRTKGSSSKRTESNQQGQSKRLAFFLGASLMPFRVAQADRTPAVFQSGRHVLVDASGAGQGRYCMAAVCMENGSVAQLHSKPCEAITSVLAEQESIEWASVIWPNALVWNDCIPAIEQVLLEKPTLQGWVYWPTPRMRKPFHDMVHNLSVMAREFAAPAQWVLAEKSSLALGNFFFLNVTE